MKGIASLETRLCPVCQEVHETGALLISKRLKEMERTTLSGISLCDQCEKRAVTHVALVCVTGDEENPTIADSFDKRTGEIAWVSREAWPHVFDCPPPDILAFCEPELIEKLKEMSAQ